MNRLFVYGTLMSEEVMRAVTGQHFSGIPCTLDDFQRFSIEGADYPGIKSLEGESVEGLLYQDITDTVWALLDDFEGDMYQRIDITVTASDNTVYSAYTYLFKEQFQHLLTDRPWSFNTFITQQKNRFLLEC